MKGAGSRCRAVVAVRERFRSSRPGARLQRGAPVCGDARAKELAREAADVTDGSSVLHRALAPVRAAGRAGS